ncbi:DEAD/DEAH box helicase [Ruminococcaceae bacterium OttesenSCG-928-A16]|nr:DEAD/DEAH box helicase [Ruminococcaceae bacterium OttesenSCG-928-A16]
MNFEQLTLIPPLLRAVASAGYTTPSPIQEKAIPPVLAGRDLLGCAQTGTGKTAAFALPILQLLAAKAPKRKGAIRALILTPTRELALQIQENFALYGQHLPLRSAVIFGGVGQGPQVAALRKGIDILVATPGRLNDLIGQGFIKLDAIEIFVLDEADRMLDMGFVHDVKKVIKLLPEKRQTLLFSATMPTEIVKLADSLLHKPTKVFVTPASTTVEKIEQTIYKVDKGNKRHLLAQLLRTPAVTSALVFTRTKHGADRVVRELSREGIKALAIHGNKSQGARQNALGQFKDGKIKVLVATDIAARGIDINELSHVFNYDLPNEPETYVHRIGRTGRAGNGGVAIAFCNFDELDYLRDIEKLIGFTIPEVKDHDWPMEIFEKAVKQPRGGKPQNAGNAKKAQPAKAGKAPASKGKKGQPAAQQGAKPPMAAGQGVSPAPKQHKNAPQKPAAAPAGRGQSRPQARGKNGPPPINPYENRTGGQAIITKKPIWGGSMPAPPTKGEDEMSRNNNRRRGGKNRGGQNKKNNQQPAGANAPVRPKAEKPPELPKNEKGVYDFSESELSEDKGIKVISRGNGEVKYASFEDYLKNN